MCIWILWSKHTELNNKASLICLLISHFCPLCLQPREQGRQLKRIHWVSNIGTALKFLEGRKVSMKLWCLMFYPYFWKTIKAFNHERCKKETELWMRNKNSLSKFLKHIFIYLFFKLKMKVWSFISTEFITIFAFTYLCNWRLIRVILAHLINSDHNFYSCVFGVYPIPR